MRLLSETDRRPKISKNGKIGVLSAVLHLSPANTSGFEVCPKRSDGCTAACLHYAGLQRTRKYQARILRTKMFFQDRELFFKKLIDEIGALGRRSERLNLRPGIRLNGTSDIPWESICVPGYSLSIIDLFPNISFYDYTKRTNRKNVPKNYKLTFSRSENNYHDCLNALYSGMNVAVVFADRLPFQCDFGGILYPVIDGDDHDFRYGDYETYDHRVIVGLRAKGQRGRQDKSDFVVRWM